MYALNKNIDMNYEKRFETKFDVSRKYKCSKKLKLINFN